jgi:hypothetical protein
LPFPDPGKGGKPILYLLATGYIKDFKTDRMPGMRDWEKDVSSAFPNITKTGLRAH